MIDNANELNMILSESPDLEEFGLFLEKFLNETETNKNQETNKKIFTKVKNYISF